MAYPPAPWTLKGYAAQFLTLVDVDRARPFIPSDLSVVSVLPGKTASVVYLAAYGPGSVLEYNELIVSTLTRHAGKIGFWISHIYVDDSDSMAGSREIWGLPKELAQFTWSEDRREVTVRQGEQLLCTLRSGKPRWLLRTPIFLPALSALGSDILSFTGNVSGRLGLGGSTLEVPAESPFAALDVAGHHRLTMHLRDMHFVASAPKVIGKRRAQEVTMGQI